MGFLTFLLPSFLSRQQKTTRPNVNSLSLLRLHGLRGLAAIIVVFRHLLVSFWEFPDRGYGYVNPETGAISPDNNLIQLPILRFIYSGNSMVTIFFVLSGYVDSLKPLKMIHTKQWESLQNHFASAIFKRTQQLFLPAFIVAVSIAIAVWLGLYEWALEYRLSFFDGLPTHLERHITILGQMRAMWSSFFPLLNVWTWDNYQPDFNIHLWTLPFEYRASLVRYLILVSLSRLSSPRRIVVLVGIIIYCHCWGRWEIALSVGGMLLCEVDLIYYSKLENPTQSCFDHDRKNFSSELEMPRVLSFILVLLSLYFCSYPKTGGAETPGYRFISSLVPRGWEDYRYWNCWGALILVYVVLHSTTTNFLLFPSFQYLGSIGFSMYLLHGPVLHATVYALVPMAWKEMIVDMKYERLFWFSAIVLAVFIPILICLVDLFERAVRRPCERTALKFQQALFDKDDG